MYIKSDAKPRNRPLLPVKLKGTAKSIFEIQKTPETQETFQEPDDPNPAYDTLSSSSSDSLYNPFG